MSIWAPGERDQLIKDIAAAVYSSVAPHSLTDDEQRWVKMAIQREADRAELQRAIITKSLTGLVWLAVTWAGITFYGGFIDGIKHALGLK